MKHFAALTALLFSFQIGADEPSAFDQALQIDTAVETREANAEFFNVRYRQIETKTATFYAKSAEGGPNTIEVYCGQPKFFTDNHLKVGNPVMFQRSRRFLQALNESCSAPERKKMMDLELEPGKPNKTVKQPRGAKKAPQ